MTVGGMRFTIVTSSMCSEVFAACHLSQLEYYQSAGNEQQALPRLKRQDVCWQ
jgi:hypothetical protein